MTAGERLQTLYPKRHFRPVLVWPSLRGLGGSTASRRVFMTNLRQSRWLQVFSEACSARSSLATAALVGALVLPGVAWGAPHSHARHPLPTALRTSHVTDGEAHAAGKKHKGGLKSRTGAEAEAGSAKRGAGTKQNGKRGSKGRGRRAEPVNDPVPLFRAERGGQNGPPAAQRETARVWHGRRGSLADEPAPLASSWRHGQTSVRGNPHGRSLSEYAAVRPAPLVGGSASRLSGAAERRPPSADVSRYPSMARDPATGGYYVAQPRPYAQGVSHPDDDERTPRARGAADGLAVSATPAPLGVSGGGAPPRASESAGPTRGGSATPRQPAVVQGFGGEVAVPPDPSSTSSDRPGGTRRRNHPSIWMPEPTALTAEPLEEREAITDAAVSPAVLPELYDSNGRLVMRAPLKGSRDVLVHQNVMADNDGLERIQTDADLERLRAAHLLVALPASESLHVNEDLPANRRVARPWTAMFAVDIGRAFYQRFHEPVYLTSAVRTVQYQARLQMVNGNAAGLWGDTASPHLTGQAVDLAKRGMSNAELAWMRGYLLPLMQAGKIDVEEEFHQACFHVSVYRSYAVGRRVLQHEVAQVHATGTPEPDATGPEVPQEK